MIQCCDYPYVKFRKKDGSLDEDIWLDMMMKRFKQEWPSDVERNGQPPEPCTCSCHNHGDSSMH